MVELLCQRGKTVVALDVIDPGDDRVRDDVTWARVDMRDYDAVLRALEGCDGLVHLAAIPTPGHLPDAEVHGNNVVASYNALRAGIEVGIRRICQASSINAVGAGWSSWPRYDYFPLDENHASYVEDPYSLSKLICEQQGDSLVRRYDSVAIASLRFHMVVPGRGEALERSTSGDGPIKNLWGYTSLAASAGSCLMSLSRTTSGTRRSFVVAPSQVGGEYPSVELARRYYPEVPLRSPLEGYEGFFDCSKAARLLGWRHDEW